MSIKQPSKKIKSQPLSEQSLSKKSTNTVNSDPDFLENYSTDQKDRKWDFHKSASQVISHYYQTSQEFEKRGHRVESCAEILRFKFIDDLSTGESLLKLRSAQFCRVRLCPVCQWRRSMLWRAKLFQKLPTLLQEHKTLKFLFLTLTVENCDIQNLSQTLKDMNSAFSRMRKLKKFTSVVKGYIRSTEVTKSSNGQAHPHFHIILAVNSNYFKKTFIKTQLWAEMWQQCLRVSYLPIVDARRIKQDKSGNLDSKAIIETLKYTTKTQSLVEDQSWFLEFSRQIDRKRFIDTGGIFKDILKEEVTNEEMALLEPEEKLKQEEEELKDSIYFGYNQNFQKYKKINIKN